MPIVFLDVDPEDRASVLARFPDARCLEEAPTGDDLVRACEGAEIVSTFVRSPFPRDVIERLPDLRLLCTRSVGYDHIDLAACAERNIVACHVPDYGAHVIAEHAFALLLSAARHVEEARRRVAEGSFEYRGLRGIALRGKTIGIVGTGKIGAAAARIARGFGMRILATDGVQNAALAAETGLTYVPLERLMAESDVVTLHLPSTPATRHLVNDAALAGAKKGLILVNTARGAIVDPDTLLRALESGVVSLALLDVLEDERHPEAQRSLVAHPRVVVTPHVGFYADDSMRAMYDDCFASIEQWRAGNTPKHAVSGR